MIIVTHPSSQALQDLQSITGREVFYWPSRMAQPPQPLAAVVEHPVLFGGLCLVRSRGLQLNRTLPTHLIRLDALVGCAGPRRLPREAHGDEELYSSITCASRGRRRGPAHPTLPFLVACGQALSLSELELHAELQPASKFSAAREVRSDLVHRFFILPRW
jgi:hypothetical protein